MTSFALEPIYGSLLLTLVAAVITVAVILAVTPPIEDRTHRRWLILKTARRQAILENRSAFSPPTPATRFIERKTSATSIE